MYLYLHVRESVAIVTSPNKDKYSYIIINSYRFICKTSVTKNMFIIKVIRHVFGFGIEFLKNEDIGMYGHFMVIDFITRYSSHTYFYPFQLPDFVDLELGVLSVMVNSTYLWIIPYSQHCFLWNFVFYSRKVYLAHQYKKMLYHPWSYRIAIDEIPIPLKRICVLSYLYLLIAKVLFETSLKSFQYNTKDQRYPSINTFSPVRARGVKSRMCTSVSPAWS